jgi:hypothetical protein
MIGGWALRGKHRALILAVHVMIWAAWPLVWLRVMPPSYFRLSDALLDEADSLVKEHHNRFHVDI